MKYRVLFYKNNGNVVGYLDKDLYKVFKSQRDMEQFNVIKMDEKEVNDAFEYYDIARYTPMFIDDLILFPHEEIKCLEIIQEDIYMIWQELEDTARRLLSAFKLNENEKGILKLDVATILVKYDDMLKYRTDYEQALNYREVLINKLKHLGLRDDFE